MQLIIDGRESPLPAWFDSFLADDPTVHEFVIRLAIDLKARNRWVKDFEHAGSGDNLNTCRSIKIVTDDLSEVIWRVKAPLAALVRDAQEIHREAATELRDAGNTTGKAFSEALEFWQETMDAIDVLASVGEFDAARFNDERIEALLTQLIAAANDGDRVAAAGVMDELADEAARLESLI